MSQSQSWKALVTGASGFVGGHLMDYLLLQGWHVYGVDRHAAIDAKNLQVGDLMDRGRLRKILKDCQPDVIFHLAGLIKSTEPEALYRANLLATSRLFESLVETGQNPLVIVTSSSAVYGYGLKGKPITERFRPRPVTHYAVSKLAQEIAALHYFDAFQLPVMVVRMFNLLGPGQSFDLACSAFARQIAVAETGENNEIVTSDLNARRDFVDVRDAVRAFVLLAEHGKGGQIYNVCSGRAVSIRRCLGKMLSMSPRQLRIRVDVERTQRNDVPVQIGDARKLNRLTGWKPQIPLEQSLSDLLAYWRQKVRLGLE